MAAAVVHPNPIDNARTARRFGNRRRLAPHAEARMAVTRLSGLLALVPVVVAIGCKSGGRLQAAPGDKVYTAHVITTEAIERSGATDAWEIIKKLSTMARARESYDGEPQRLEPKRGHGSIVLRDDPMVYVDGIPLSDLRTLRQIGAHDVDSIEEMGSIEATAYFGTNSNAGVILIHSRTRPAD